MLQYIVIVLICNYFPKLLKTHFFIYFANKMNNKKQNDKKRIKTTLSRTQSFL